MPLDAKEVRRRRSSSLVYTEPPESLEQLSDQSALPNLNAQWVNAKGEWQLYLCMELRRAGRHVVPPIMTRGIFPEPG